MPNISSLTMPDGIVYAIKDSQARKDIEDIKKNSSGSGGSGGSSLDDYSPYIVNITGIGTDNMATDADFNTAKEYFLSHKPVLCTFTFSRDGEPTQNLSLLAILYLPGDDGAQEAIGFYFPGSQEVIQFKSDGSIAIS